MLFHYNNYEIGDFKPFVLGEEGERYITKCLNSNDILSQLLLKTINLSEGEITTFLPTESSKKDISNFERGGIIHVPKKLMMKYKSSNLVPKISTDSWVENELRIFFDSNPKGCFLRTNPLYNATDDVLKESNEAFLVCKNNVYSIYNANSFQIKNGNIVQNTPWPSLVGITIKMSEKEYKKGITKINKFDLEKLTQHTEQMIFNAYDGESYLIWNKVSNN